MEIWKDIKGYENMYQVSSFGNVRSLDRKINGNWGKLIMRRGFCLKKGTDRGGYEYVSLCKGNKYKKYNVHVLVAITFLNHKPCGHKIVVDHIDGDRLNNNVSNLQLITSRENISKGMEGKSKYTGVDYNKRQKKWRARIYVDGKRKFLGTFDCELAAAKAYNDELKKIKI